MTYTYGTSSASNNNGRLVTVADGQRTHRYVSQRTLTVNGQSYQWNFSRTGANDVYTVVVTDPLGNQSRYVTDHGVVKSAEFYQGAIAGNPLRRHDLTYAWDSDPWYEGGTGVPPDAEMQQIAKRPIRVKTTLEDGRVSEKEFDYDSITYTYHPYHDTDFWMVEETFTTTRGNVTEIREYEWGAVPGSYGSGVRGPLVQRTARGYLHDSNPAYLTRHIVNKVLSEAIYDGAGAQKAQTQYEYDSTAITGTSGAPQHDYTNYPSSFTYRGNASRVRKWRNTDGALLTSTYNYDDLGNILSLTDPGGHTTNWSYTDSWANSFCLPPANSLAYATQVTNALSHRIQVTRFPCTGLVQAHKDENDILAARAGTTFTYDLLGRLLTKNAADGGQTSNSYDDVPPVSATSTTKITGSMNLVSTSIRDGLGRASQSQLTSDPEGTVYGDTTYDALGRTSTVTNPYRSLADPTYGTTTYNYDGLSRVTKVIPPDGSGSANNVSTTYSGNCVTVTDQAAKKRKSCADALGRLTQVFEPNASGSFIYETDYQYDTLDNLTRVDQKGNDANSANWRTRTFTYNSLSQLLTASNPESGTITYTYDSDGNLLTKRDARLITITYSYDALHRLTGKTYSNGDPAVSYFYDQSSYNGLAISNGKGRRTGMSDASGTTAWNYDSEGRALTERRTISGITKVISYTYNLDGSLASLTYFGGRVVTYAYNAAARPLSAIDTAFSINYATLATYAPQGALAGVKYGVTGSFTGIVTSNSYNSRLQPIVISATAPSQTVLSFSYGFGLGTANNGNVLTIQNNRNLNRSQTFTYDELNRVKTAEVPTAWGLSFGYDIWANLLSQTVTKGSAPMLSVAANTKNQIVGFSYDAAGNLINDGSLTYTYDAESRISTTAGVTYTYDGDGERVKKSSGIIYWGNAPLAEGDFYGNIIREFIFFGGKRMALLSLPGGAVRYYFSDHLGSSNVVTNADGSVIQQEYDFYPFGGGRVLADILYGTQNYKFTGKERDLESGLDYFGARYYSSSLGRFITPDEFAGGPVDAFSSNDPAPSGALPYADIGDPQSLNKYTYAYNNPLRYNDPNGHAPCPPCVDLGSVNELIDQGTKEGAKLILLGTAWTAAATAAAGGAVVGAFYVADTRITNTIVENNNDDANLAAQESRAAGENRQKTAPEAQPAAGGAGARKGGEPPQLKAGKEAHKNEEVRPGENAEVRTPSGKRMDRYNVSAAHIREIKPANAKGEKAGQKQVNQYKTEMDKATGRSHTTEVTKYKK